MPVEQYLHGRKSTEMDFARTVPGEASLDLNSDFGFKQHLPSILSKKRWFLLRLRPGSMFADRMIVSKALLKG